ncbi:MAG: hypothetical protein COA79_09625 [Planctomycetota bacterium]|nr:MAG: hypothetical protein COA79_09625 [Planctomycetota bacterium]
MSSSLFAADLNSVKTRISTVKKYLAKWHKTSDQKLILDSLIILTEIKKDLKSINDRDEEYESIKQEVYMLFFWANKSKVVISKKRRRSTRPLINIPPLERPKKLTDAEVNDAVILAKLLSTEPKKVVEEFKHTQDFTKNNPNAYYESEYMYRDIYFEHPESNLAEIANKYANSINIKIIKFEQEKEIKTNNILNNISDFEKLYTYRKFGQIEKKLKDLYDQEKDKITKHIIGHMIKEYQNLNVTMKAIDQLIKNKKKNPISGRLIGLKFNGSIIGASEKSVSIKTKMGTVSLPWKKVNDKQLADLITQLSQGVDVSYRIPLAMYKLGNAYEAFKIIYHKILRDPLFATKLGIFYFELLYHFRLDTTKLVDATIARSNKLAKSKDIAGAIKILTKCLLQINKTKFQYDEVARIRKAINTLGK